MRSHRSSPTVQENIPMRVDMVSRTSSEGSGAPSSRKWNQIIQKFPGRPKHKIKILPQSSDAESNDPYLNLKSPDTNSGTLLPDTQDSNIRQLQGILQRMRTPPAVPNQVDAAYNDFMKVKDQCAALCRLVLTDELGRSRDLRGPEVLARQDSTVDAPRSPGQIYDTRSSFSGRSLAEVVSGSVGKSIHQGDASLSVVREWKNYLESLAEACRTSLADTYKNYERDAGQDMVDAMFANKAFRKSAVQRMRNASVTRVMSADPQFFPKYEMRFYNHDRIKQELLEIRILLQTGESGISPDRTIIEYPISPRGDAILEFANNPPEGNPGDPALRFRVSSYTLAETSPIFARMFAGHSSSLHLYDDDDISLLLPSPPTKYYCKDGAEIKLYRMPQIELNSFNSLEILMHAGHMHNEVVPREVSFEQFIAIAECCMRYKCTSPLELVVEHRWLPQWMHKGADDMPDGLLVISYAFGLRQLFSRMSKTAILNIVDERELQAKQWPLKIKEKLWAVRQAKVAQVYASCISMVQDYLGAPADHQLDSPVDAQRGSISSGSIPPAILTSKPRCPKGSHWCDATNLGWLLLVFNEMNILSHIMQQNVLSHLPDAQSQPRSLVQIVECLKGVPTPPTPIHRGVCDPGPAFRSAISDIYNSVLGLTLYDISGKSHGWALSKHREREPQAQLNTGLSRMAAGDVGYSVVTDFPDIVRLRVMCDIDSLDDLHAMAMVSRPYYETYKQHELFLMRNILRLDRRRSTRPVPMSASNAEEKVLKEESDVLKSTPADAADAVTLHSVEDEDDYSDSDDSFDSSMPVRTYNQRQHSNASQISPGTTPRPISPADSPLESPSTPRQVAVAPAEVLPTEEIEEPPLTEEEARRILWPDEAIAAVEAPTHIPDMEGLREKFRAGDPAFAEGLEEKTLVPTGDKQLRSEHDRRVGILKGDSRQGSTSK